MRFGLQDPTKRERELSKAYTASPTAVFGFNFGLPIDRFLFLSVSPLAQILPRLDVSWFAPSSPSVYIPYHHNIASPDLLSVGPKKGARGIAWQCNQVTRNAVSLLISEVRISNTI